MWASKAHRSAAAAACAFGVAAKSAASSELQGRRRFIGREANTRQDDVRGSSQRAALLQVPFLFRGGRASPIRLEDVCMTRTASHSSAVPSAASTAPPPAQEKTETAAPPAPAPQASKPASTTSKRSSGSVSVDQEMIKARRLFITGDINDDSVKKLVQELLFLESEDPHEPVVIFINSGGGLVHSGLALLDVMSGVSMPIHTVAYGRCFSIAALLLSAGTPGHRRAYSNARLMIHEPSCSYPKLPATDVMIKAKELNHTQRALEAILAARTGRPQAEVAIAVARDNYMSPLEAKEFGIVDVVLPAKQPLVDIAATAVSEGSEPPAVPTVVSAQPESGADGQRTAKPSEEQP